MTQKNTFIFIIVSVLLLLMVYNMKNNAYHTYIEKKEQLVTFKQEAREIGALKKRFKDKSATRRLIATLEKLAKPSKDYDKSKVHILVFENLPNNVLNAILRKIENSGLKVKKLEVNRVDAKNAKVRLEIQK